MSEIWIATTNRGKVDEFRQILHDLGIVIRTAADLGVYTPPKETGKTFKENALIKARTMRALKPSQWAIGEDSGLEVDGLGGMPGIHSARYAGEKASDSENVAKLLKMMSLRSAENRKARFLCAVAAFDPDGQEHHFEGVVDGEISRSPKGTTGFGYDPVFIPKGESKTFAELGLAFKNSRSHRAKAIEELKKIIAR